MSSDARMILELSQEEAKMLTIALNNMLAQDEQQLEIIGENASQGIRDRMADWCHEIYELRERVKEGLASTPWKVGAHDGPS